MQSLEGVPLFESLPPQELERLSGTLRRISLEDGGMLFYEGEPGEHFYIITGGQVEIIKAFGSPDQRLIALRQEGDFFGEMSLLKPGGLRMASVRAHGSAELLEMPRTEFEGLIRRNPWLAYELMRTMSDRLEQSHETAIRDLHEKNRALQQAYEELQAAQAQIIEAERLERDLLIASQVQAGLLPQEIPAIAGWELAATWKPARQVSGDFYDFIPLPDGRWGLVVADATDKGMPAALVMATTRSVLRSVVTAACRRFCRGRLPREDRISPAGLLTQTNQLLYPDMALNMFITCLLVVIDPRSGEMQVCNAGHNLPYLRTADGVEKLRVTGLPLGLFPDIVYEDRTWTIAPGEALLMYSDGLVEAHDPSGEMFDYPRLEELLEYCTQVAPLQGDDLIQFLLSSLLSFTGPGWEQEDDVTLLSIYRCPEDK